MTAVTLPPDLAAIDPFAPDLWSSGQGYAYHDWLREHDPVHWDEARGFWVLGTYDDVAYVERHPELFSSAHGILPQEGSSLEISMISMDDPEHARQRRLVSRGFTPRRIQALADRIRSVTRELIDEVAADGECDFVRQVAYQVPLIVIAEMLGMPVEDRARLGEWSDTMMGAAGLPPGHPALDDAGRAWGEYITYLVPLLAERAENPRDDLISVLVAAGASGELDHLGDGVAERVGAGDIDDDQLHDDEVLQFCTLLLVAGNETTRNALSAGMAALSDHPDQRDALAADPSLVVSATEEILRWASPVLAFSRTVTDDVELRGRRLRAGDTVLLSYPAANRDPQQFPDPYRFDIRRDPNLHLAFGAGPHFCLGANLARTEIRIVFEELLARLPDVRVAPGAGPERVPSALVATIDSLPIVFTPA